MQKQESEKLLKLCNSTACSFQSTKQIIGQEKVQTYGKLSSSTQVKWCFLLLCWLVRNKRPHRALKKEQLGWKR